MISVISGFGFFWSKNGRFVTHICFSKKQTCWNPYFYSVFWVRAFWAKLSKTESWDTHQNKRKNLTDNWKALFWYFLCFLCYFLFFFSLFCFWVFVFLGGFCFFCFCFLFEGFKGQVRWPEGPPHLALNPPYLFFGGVLLFFGVFLEGLRIRWGGPKGHLTCL